MWHQDNYQDQNIVLYIKLTIATFLVYLSGRFHVSLALVLLIVLLLAWKQSHHTHPRPNIRIPEIFPDYERAEFLNRLIQKFWPFCADHLRKTIFVEVIEKTVRFGTVPAILGDFKFIDLDLGDVAPQIGGIKVYDTSSSQYDELVLDFELCYFGDARIRFSSNKLVAGVKNIQVIGNCRAIFKPLINRMPFAGAVSFSFLHYPLIDFEMTDIANVFDIPGLKNVLKTVINGMLDTMLIAPNKLLIPLASEIETTDLFKPKLKGVLMVGILSGKDIARADFSMLNRRGKSDPYVNVYLEKGRVYKTKVIDNSTHPQWNEVFHLIVEQNEDDGRLVFEVRDEDPGEDDFLGSCELSIKEAIKAVSFCRSVNLENISTGSLKLAFQWYTLSSKISSFDSTNKSNNFPRAVLIVYVGAATNLPMSKRTNFAGMGAGFAEPDPFIKIKVEDHCAQSHTLYRTTNPVFNYVARFLIRNPDLYDVVTEVRDQRNGDGLISQVRVHMNDVFKSDDMCVEMNHPLRFVSSSAGNSRNSESRIFVRYSLEIMEGSNDLTDLQIDSDRFSVASNDLQSNTLAQTNGPVVKTSGSGTLKRILFGKKKKPLG